MVVQCSRNPGFSVFVFDSHCRFVWIARYAAIWGCHAIRISCQLVLFLWAAFELIANIFRCELYNSNTIRTCRYIVSNAIPNKHCRHLVFISLHTILFCNRGPTNLISLNSCRSRTAVIPSTTRNLRCGSGSGTQIWFASPHCWRYASLLWGGQCLPLCR